MYGHGKKLIQEPIQFRSVSFVIPAHNEAKYIGKTLDALNLAIVELELEAEVIVVSDASTDQTAEIAESKYAKVMNVDLRNIGAVRNAGASTAENDWLVFVDADTTVPTETLRQAMTHLATGGIGGGSRVDLDGDKPLFWLKNLMYYGVVTVWQIIGGWAAGCFMFCERSAFEDFGGFDEAFFAAEEYYFSCELKKRGRFRLMKNPVITSARKLYKYSSLDLMKFVFLPLFRLKNAFTSRRGLGILYEDVR